MNKASREALILTFLQKKTKIKNKKLEKECLFVYYSFVETKND